jgi:hypothetical protein
VTEIDAIAHMRCAAALLSCTSTISARLVRDDVVVLEAMPPPHPVRDHAVVPPCWFRALVADRLASGLPTGSADRLRFERLLACRIELGVRGGTILLPGNVLRVDAGSSWMHLHAIAAPAEAVKAVAVALREEDGASDDSSLELHVAHDLDVTIVGQASARSDDAAERSADLLRTVSMRVAVDRLERELQAIADHPARASDDAPALRPREP